MCLTSTINRHPLGQTFQEFFGVEGNTINTFEGNNKKLDTKKRQAILKQVNSLAWLLDNSIQIPIVNYRIGWDAIVGLIPGFGDIAGMLVSSFIVLQAIRLGVPRSTLTQMVLNVAIEASVGVIPLVGDIFDATFKANARNVELLNAALGNSPDVRAIGKSASRGVITAVIGALTAIIALIGGVGLAVFSWVLSFFR